MNPSWKWRWNDLLREARKNVFSPHSRQIILSAVALSLGLTTGIVATVQWSALDQGLTALHSRGRNIIVFSSASPSTAVQIGVRSCEAISTDAGVVRAGAIVNEGTRTFRQLGPFVPVRSASPSLLPQLNDVDVVVGASLGSFSHSFDLLIEGEEAHAAERLERQPAGIDLNSAVTFALSPTVTTANLCVVELEKFENVQTAAPRLQAQLEISSGSVTATPALAETFDTVSNFASQLLRFYPLAAGLGGAALFGVVLRFRQSEIAAYRLSGTSRQGMISILWAEQVSVAGIATLSSAASMIPGVMVGVIPVATLGWAWVLGGVWLTVSAAFSFALTGGNPFDMAKDR